MHRIRRATIKPFAIRADEGKMARPNSLNTRPVGSLSLAVALLVLVGSTASEARAEIRASLQAEAFREPQDCCAVA